MEFTLQRVLAVKSAADHASAAEGIATGRRGPSTTRLADVEFLEAARWNCRPPFDEFFGSLIVHHIEFLVGACTLAFHEDGGAE